MSSEDMQNLNSLVERIQNRLKAKRQDDRADRVKQQPAAESDTVSETAASDQKRRRSRKVKDVEDSSGRGVIYIVR